MFGTKRKQLIAFVLDGSGSMEAISDDVIGSFNSLIKEQQRDNPEALFLMNVFSATCKRVIEPTVMTNVSLLTVKTYIPNGQTALLDALATTIAQVKELLATGEDYTVTVAILTDGKENASTEFRGRATDVGAMIQKAEADGWAFHFLSSDFDAIEEAADLHIHHSIHIRGRRGVHDTMSDLSQEFSRGGRNDSDPDSSGGGLVN